MQVKVSHKLNKDNFLIISFSGDLQMIDSPFIRKEIEKVLDQTSSFKKLIFDLSKMGFIDSSGLGVFFYFQKMMFKKKIPFILKAVPPEILSISVPKPCFVPATLFA